MTFSVKKYLDKDFVNSTILTDLSKAFDCIPHDLLTNKRETCDLGEKALSHICSYLTNRNQCARIMIKKKKKIYKIISSLPQGSTTASILFNFLINDLFFFISNTSMYNFVHDQIRLLHGIEAVSSIIFVGIQLDDKLNFNLHVSNICKSPANQLISLTLWCLLRSLTTAHRTRPPIIHKLDLDYRNFCGN